MTRAVGREPRQLPVVEVGGLVIALLDVGLVGEGAVELADFAG